MSTLTPRRLFVSSLVAGALWLLVVAIRWGFWQLQNSYSQLGTLVPDLVPVTVWTWPDAWPALIVVLAALAVVTCHVLVASLATRRGEASAAVGVWFAAVAAGAIVGLAMDLAVAWDSLALFGPRGLLGGEFATTAAWGALWGLVIGWMPGLVAARAPAAETPSAENSAAEASARRSSGWLVAAAAAAVVAVVVAGIAGESAKQQHFAALAEAEREAQAETSFGAPPDPNATGEPVPETAGVSVELDPQWCTEDRAVLLSGEPDAATGHRALPIRLMNFSEEPCVIEGYPDIAFGDQNGHLLAATVEPGSSFMTQDLGPQRIEIPAGGSAITVLGWDAASPHGALVTKTVYAAPTAGMVRGSWPIDLDIVEGSTVAVTAWQLDAPPAGE